MSLLLIPNPSPTATRSTRFSTNIIPDAVGLCISGRGASLRRTERHFREFKEAGCAQGTATIPYFSGVKLIVDAKHTGSGSEKKNFVIKSTTTPHGTRSFWKKHPKRRQTNTCMPRLKLLRKKRIDLSIWN